MIECKRGWVAAALFAGVTLIGGTAATAQTGLNFRDIEYRYEGEQARTAGVSAVTGAIAIGSTVAEAVGLLRGAGAFCKPVLRRPDQVRCFYNQSSSKADTVEDVRWTTILHSQGGRVTDVSVGREANPRFMN